MCCGFYPFLVLPKVVPFSFDEPMYSEDAAQVTCLVASGDQPLDIWWTFEGHNISVLPGVTVTKVGSKTSLLLIDPVNGLHRGNYTCIVRNPAGSTNYTAGLRINGKRLLFPLSQLHQKSFLSSSTTLCQRGKLLKSLVSFLLVTLQ